MTEHTTNFEGWAILELMGHRRLAGYVREQEIAGHGFIRIDVPAPAPGGGSESDGMVATQFYSPGSIYCMTPTTETLARQVAASSQPQPVHRWELPALGVPKPRPVGYEDEPEDDEGLP